ncbi:MAG: TRAP transporter small permease [Rhodobacterales bacterium]|nr:TRAP transporter small permease [Rhodobacterales bacterium]MDX5500539.1 TRAP transporter small permease [Rhodobacterales bacterium]
MQTIWRAVTGVTRLGTILGGIAIALMMVHVSLDVLFRHVFNSPLPGTLTMVTYYYMVIATFVPLAHAEAKRAHISVEVVTEMLPRRLQHHLQGWMYLATGAVLALLAWRSWVEALKAMKLGASQVQGAETIAVWPAYFALPVGAGLMALLLGLRFVAYLTGQSARLETEAAQ